MSKIIIIIVGLSLAGGVFFLYTKPAYDDIQTTKQEVAQFDAALDKAKELQELKRALLARYNTFTTDNLNRLSRLLPDHVDNVRLVLDLDSMAARYGMAIQNVVINRAAETQEDQTTVLGALTAQASTFDSLTLQFNTRGTYNNFVSLMQDLESGLRIVDVVALSIEPEQIETQDGQAMTDPVYRYNITVRTYWLK